MCGITGIIGLNRKEDIEKMTDAISHRGPDDDGYFVDEHVALGMRRLSIIDLAGGHQPITSADGRFLILFNGEIYNYREIRENLGDYEFKTNSDTEVILAGFVKWGEKVFARLRGMFVFCIYDTRDNKIFLVRDFFGIKPLYYLKEKNRVTAFSSEIKSFLTLKSFKPKVNDEAVFNYLSFQYNPLDETFFKNVFKLPPAHYMTVDVKTGTMKIERYWQFEFKQNNSLNENKTSEEILRVMKDSVAHHMIADVPVGSFLSGGVDSSIIASLMQEIRGEKKIKTFTVGFDSLTEGREANETSNFLGTDHIEIKIGADEYFKTLPEAVYHFDEPVADPSAVGLYFLAREAAKSVKVVLSGEGADELFGGYNIYLEPFARRWISWLPRFILQTVARMPFRGKHYAERALSKLEDWYVGNASIFNKKEVEKLWKGIMSRFNLDSLYEKVVDLNDSTKMQYIDIHTWLVGDILAKADKMTMAHSLELRVPFLDIEVVHLAATLPDRFKWRRGETKYLLRQAFKKILPESVRRRKKLGFPTPVRNWFTKDRRDIYDVILNSSYIKDRMNVRYIVQIIDDHIEKRADNSRKIYLLLMLAVWYNVFIENSKLKINTYGHS